MKTLVYKRTHEGDPDHLGRFGRFDCMGRVRSWGYNAVIGVGGVGDEPQRKGIAGKVTWIGIGPRRVFKHNLRGPVVTFDRFRYFGTQGPLFRTHAPALAERMYALNIRAMMVFSCQEENEIGQILALAQDARPSPIRGSGSALSQYKRCRATRCC